MSGLQPHEELCATCSDDQGRIAELIHCYDLGQISQDEPPDFGLVDCICVRLQGTIRAFLKHKEQWNFFSVISGSVRFWVINFEQTKAVQFILNDVQISRLIIPYGCFYGWESSTPNTILIRTSSRLSNSKPDQERVEENHFQRLGVYWDGNLHI